LSEGSRGNLAAEIYQAVEKRIRGSRYGEGIGGKAIYVG